MQFYQVKLCSVAFVLAETIFRKTGAEVAHNRVARDLRDYARGRDAEAVTIAIDDSRLRQREGQHRQAVDQDMLGLNGETGQGESHRLVGCPQNIDRVDLDGIDDADGPANRVVGGDVSINLLPFLRQQLFGIVQLPVPEFFGKDNRRRYDGTCESAPSGLINTGDRRDTERAELALMPETTSPIHLANKRLNELTIVQLAIVNSFRR